MDTLVGVKTVIAVVESGSFTAAAEKLAISKSLVSKYIHEVESQLNIRLFNRNTRSISLTDAGNNYYQHALKLVEHYTAMLEDVVSNQAKPKGTLRISCPVAFGEHVVSALLPEFAKTYPDISVDLQLNNRAVNMLEEGIDVRIKSGLVNDSNMIARHLCQWPLIFCAAAPFIARHGRPSTPEALSELPCVIDSNLKNGRNWTFLSANSGHQTVLVQSNMSSNNPQAVVNMVKAGGGIGLVARGSITTELMSGELIELLPEYQSLTLDIFLIYPHRKHIPAKVQCFIDFMLAKFVQL